MCGLLHCFAAAIRLLRLADLTPDCNGNPITATERRGYCKRIAAYCSGFSRSPLNGPARLVSVRVIAVADAAAQDHVQAVDEVVPTLPDPVEVGLTVSRLGRPDLFGGPHGIGQGLKGRVVGRGERLRSQLHNVFHDHASWSSQVPPRSATGPGSDSLRPIYSLGHTAVPNDPRLGLAGAERASGPAAPDW